MADDYTLIDHTDEVLREIKEHFNAALEKCGMIAEGYAKDNITKNKTVDTGALRNSVTHKVVGRDCYIGTNIEYAPYIEFGTGVYYPGGRRTPWVWTDRDGNKHLTDGMPAKPFLKPAVTEHVEEYKRILRDE